MSNIQIAMLLAGIIMVANFLATRWVYASRESEAWQASSSVFSVAALCAVVGVVHHFVGG